MTASSFQYDWENVANVISNIYQLINFNVVGCNLYTMEYISQMLTHYSKGNLECVHQCIKINRKETNGLIFETKCSSIKQRFKKLGDGLLSKRGKNKHTCPIFDNDFLAYSNQIKLKSTDYIFPIKQDGICDYNPLCFMSSVMMLDDTIMNIFTQSTKNTTEAHQEHSFSRSKYDAIQLYKGSMQDFTWKTTIEDTKRTLCSHHYIGIEILRKYLYGITLIESTQADLDKEVDEFINDKIDFNTTHIIKSDIQPVTNVQEDTRFISSMTPTGFRNDQDESRCYVNSTFCWN